jgi:hypothetical protein
LGCKLFEAKFLPRPLTPAARADAAEKSAPACAGFDQDAKKEAPANAQSKIPSTQ